MCIRDRVRPSSRRSTQSLEYPLDVEPIEPRIYISVLDMPGGESGVEWDVRSCGSFLEDHGRWIRLRPGQEVPT